MKHKTAISQIKKAIKALEDLKNSEELTVEAVKNIDFKQIDEQIASLKQSHLKLEAQK